MHCNKDLGANESIEAFPVGRRIAFDESKGRLRAVCRHCERWNLSPIEERWEAIEQCERAFRDTRVRVSTDNIGLAKLRDGTELVWVGAPMRPECAAWRYGDQFGRRRSKALLMGAGGVVGVGVVLAGGIALGATLAAVAPAIHVANLLNLVRVSQAHGPTLLPLPDGRWFRPVGSPRLVARSDVPEGWGIAYGYSRQLEASEVPSSWGSLREPASRWRSLKEFLTHDQQPAMGEVKIRGNDATPVLRWALPRLNRAGASRTTVQEGVAMIEEAGQPERFGTWAASQLRMWSARQTFGDTGDIYQIPAPARLAFEMALHEESERRALEGELASLEAAWRHADEIAKIADGLLVNPAVERRFEALRSGEP
jgi:hypothetical protein